MNSTHRVLFSTLVVGGLLASGLTYALLPREDGVSPLAVWTYGAVDRRAAGDESPVVEHRDHLVELAEETLHLEVIERAAGAIERPLANAIVAGSTPVAKTLYMHAVAHAADVDEVDGTFLGGSGPRMTEDAPTGQDSKVAGSAFANNNFRKNSLAAYWGGAVHGTMSDIAVTLHVQSASAARLEVSLFGDGPNGVATPLGRQTVPIAAPVPTALTVPFPGTTMSITNEFVVSVIGVGNGGEVLVYYDSTVHPSSVSFTLAPITPTGPKLDDPAGIAFRAGKTVVLNAGQGNVLELDGTAAPVELAAGYYKAGFVRGLSDAVTDAAGNVYFSETDTGRVHYLTPSGAKGVYARDLGAPTGLAFNDAGDLFVGDAATRSIFKVAPSGAVTTVATIPRTPFDLAFAPNGTLTVSAFRPGTIYDVDVATGAVSTRAFLGANTTAEGIAWDAAGDLWIGTSTGNTSGRLVTLSGNTLTIANATLGGPLHLAFVPGAAQLVVASQGELSTLGDAVLTFAMPTTGHPVAAPSLAPTSVAETWDGWVHRSGGRSLPVASFAGTLPLGVLRDVGRDPSEPTLGIQSDGDIFTVAASSAQSKLRNPVVTGAGEPAVMRSRDNGASWQIVSPTIAGINDPPATADPFVYVDPTTDRVFTFDLAAACHIMSYSDDSGDTWTTNRLACGMPPVDHQSLVAAKPRTVTTDGYPNVLYHCTNWIAISPCGRSLDGGDTWTPAGPATQNILDSGTGCTAAGGLLGHLGADNEGRVFAGKALCGRPIVAVTENDGLTWRVIIINATRGISGHDIDFAVDAANNVYAMWIGADQMPYYAVSSTGGGSWGPARSVAPPGLRLTQMPSIAAADTGKVVFSYTGSNTNYGYAAQNAGKTEWNTYVTIALDALAAEPTFVTVMPHALGDPITRGDCARPCGGIWDFLDVRIAPDGRPFATTVDSCIAACATDRTASPAQFGNAHVATFSSGPRLKGSGSLGPL